VEMEMETEIKINKKIPVVGFANDVLLVKELLEKLKEQERVTVHSVYKSRYVYGNSETIDTEIYTIPNDIKKLLIEYFEHALEDFETMIKLYGKVHRIAELILPALEPVKPARKYVDSNGDDRSSYTSNYYIYEVTTPYVIKYIRKKNGRKYVTVVFETKELIDNEVVDAFEEIDRKIEYAKKFCPDISTESVEKLKEYLEDGYYIDFYLYNTITLKVGTMETSIADMRKKYEVLCGKINEEVINEEEDRFSSYRYIKITPITNSIIVYKSFYSHGWDTKAIYFLSPNLEEKKNS